MGTNTGTRIGALYEPQHYPKEQELFKHMDKRGFSREAVCTVAFEPNPVKTPVLTEMARRNSVDSRISLRGFCRPDDLKALAPEGTILLVMDVDGGERDLLDPEAVPWLGNAAILVETHDAFVPDVTALLKKRFAETHTIVEFTMRGPDYGGIKQLQDLRMFEVDALVGSERPGLQSWLWMKPLV
jgi:hypothetical protein